MDGLTCFLASLMCIVALLAIYLKWSLSYWKRKRIPHIAPAFPWGNFGNPMTSKRNFNQWISHLYLRLKEMDIRIGGIYIYSAPYLLLVEPTSIKQVLLQNFQNFHIRGLYSNEKHQPVSLNLLTAEGEKWSSLRTQLTPAFTLSKMKLMFTLMTEVAKSMESFSDECANENISLNAKDCGKKFAADIIATCAFGLNTNSFKDYTFGKTVEELLDDATRIVKVSFLLTFPKLAQLLGVPLLEVERTEYLCKLMDESTKQRRKDGSTRKDFFQILLELKNNCLINDTEMNAQCLVFILAGHETMSAALAFALFQLAINQDIQEKLRKEITEILAENVGTVTYDAVTNMKYLEMVVCEVLRMYPSIPILNRRCAADITLPDANLFVEKNTDIIVPIMALHFDPEYFPNPNKFDPERFSDENKVNIVPYTYLPFGAGPRTCIGKQFGKLELKVGVLTIIRKYRIRLNPMVKLPLKLAPSLVIKPDTDILLDIERIGS